MLLVTTFYLIRVSHTRNPSPPPFPSGCLTPKILPRHHFPSECLTPGILLRRHSTRMPRIRNPIRRRSTFPGCLTSGILSVDIPLSPDASHPESYSPTFHLPRMPHIRNPIRRRSTFFGCLTSRILSSRRSTFFFILRAFSLGSKITFLIKLCYRFYF